MKFLQTFKGKELRNCVVLGWYQDLKKYDIVVQHIFKPSTNQWGLRYKKGKETISALLPLPETKLEKNYKEICREFWEIEKHFGVKKEDSNYYKEVKTDGENERSEME
jgi:hypothetical protein